MWWGWDLTSLIANFTVSGAWILQGEALFYLRVADTDADSYANCSMFAILATSEEEKKCKYLSVPVLCLGSFTTFCISWWARLANDFVALCRMVNFVTGYGRKQIS